MKTDAPTNRKRWPITPTANSTPASVLQGNQQPTPGPTGACRRVNNTRQPMALTEPTHLENEAESASRRLNALGLTRNQSRRTSHERMLLSGFHDTPLRHFTGKFAYISLSTPTPCLPRGAVPVNLGNPCSDAWAGFRQNPVRNATRSIRCMRLGMKYR